MEKKENLINKIIPFLISIFPIAFVLPTLDNDFWFIINHGRYILKDGIANIFNVITSTTVEPFTIHHFNFTFEKWATSVLYYKIYEIFGATGMYILMLLFFLIICILTYKCCTLASKNRLISSIMVLSSLAVFAVAFVKTRPQIISYILLLLEFYCLEKYAQNSDNKSSNKYLLILPLLSFLYMQFHSTMWPMFLIIFLPFLADIKLFDLKYDEVGNYSKKPIYIALIASILIAFINPYGYKSVLYLFKSLSSTSMNTVDIAELGKFTIDDIIFALPILILQIAWLWNKERENIPLRYVLLDAGTLFMALYAKRNIAYFLLFGCICTSSMYKKYDLKVITNKFNIKAKRAVAVLLPICIVFIAIISNSDCDIYKPTSGYAALNKLAQEVEPSETRLMTSFGNGSYAEWLQFKTYIDPRAEVFVKEINNNEDILKEYMSLSYAGKDYNDIQEKYNFDYWAVDKNSVIDHLLSRDDNFELIISEDDTRIYTALVNNQSKRFKKS